MSEINSSLQKVKWEEEMENKGVNQSWRFFRSKIEEVVKNDVPLKERRKQRSKPPWQAVIQNTIQEANDDDDDDDLIPCSELYASSIRAAKTRTEKAIRTHDDILPTRKGSRLVITSTCSESRDPIFLRSMAR